MRNWPETVISQYSSSQALTLLIECLDDNLDPSTDLQMFYTKIWNIDTAEGYGLDVWGRIVGISRILQVATGKYFGFDEAGLSVDNFGPGGASPFYSGQALTGNYALTDEAYRHLILTKAAANITDGSIKSINQLLMFLFPQRGNAYVTEGPTVPVGPWFGFTEATDAAPFGQGVFGDQRLQSVNNMTMTFVFNFVLTPVEISIVTASGVLPKSTGVAATYLYKV